MIVPVLETPRLTLRGRIIADFPAYDAMWSDAGAVRYTSGTPLTREDSWMRFARSAGLWALTGYGSFIVEEKATGAVVGDVGPADYGRDIEPSLAGKPEFGWVVATAAQGKGYATEAMRAALAWSEAKFPGATFSCIIDPDNAPSLNVAAKLGFVEAARTTYKAKPIIVLERAPGQR